MRWVIRFFLLIVFAVGVVLAILYPWAAENLPGYEVGKWRVYDRATGYSEAEMSFAPSEVPVWVTMDVYSDGPIENPEGVIVLTMTTSVGGRTIRAETFTLENVEPREFGPQSSERLYSLETPKIVEVEDKPYVFVVGPGEDDFPVIAIDLTARAGAIDIDPAVPRVGYVVMGIAGLLLFMTFRRRRGSPSPKSPPPPPKWGRQ